jgi:UDP:flavonoid glycosyltransferase YjiC (YdhE family)
VVLAHSAILGARIAQDHLGIPTLTGYLSPAQGLRSVHEPPLAPPLISPGNSLERNRRAYGFADRFVFDPVLGGTVNRLRAELGLLPCKQIIGGWQNSPDGIIGLFPEWFAPRQPDWPETLRLTGFPLYDEQGLHALPASLQRFLDANDPPIVFTATSDAKKSRGYFQECIRATQELGRRGVILTRHVNQLPKALPDGFLHVDYAPFSQILRRAAALVHFTGIGSTSQALAAGIPQLSIPQRHDQHDTAARIEKLGVGRAIRSERKRGELMVDGLHELLHSSSIRDNCRRIAGLIDPARTLDQICNLIEEFQPRALRRAA